MDARARFEPLIRAKADEYGLDHGWNLFMCPEEQRKSATFAIMGLNPGGGANFKNDGEWALDHNAYFVQRTHPDQAENPLHGQISAWHDLAGIDPDATICAQYVPFRTPNWNGFAQRDDALKFSRGIWADLLANSPVTTVIGMSRVLEYEFGQLWGVAPFRDYPTGWKIGRRGEVKIRLFKDKGGKRFVSMPHPSRFRLFRRSDGKSALAEASFRSALTD